MCEIPRIAGLTRLWRLTRGDPRIRVAVVDGVVDRGHPALARARLVAADGTSPARASGEAGAKAAHGTAVAGVLFGHGQVAGVAPGCTGVLVPVFRDERRTSQMDLARGIEAALDAGAHLINVSGGQLTESGEAEDLLARAVRRCREQNVLVVAAVGNDGCFCDHVPAALPSVLAVGALDDTGRPLATSNWGPRSRRRGLMAPGHDITVAVPGGGTAKRSGTSLATPIVTGVAALLLSLQARAGRRPDPHAVADLLLASADPCDLEEPAACERLLTGKLNITKAVITMTKDIRPATDTPAEPLPTLATSCADPEQVTPSGSCQCTGESAQLPAPQASEACQCAGGAATVPTPRPAADAASSLTDVLAPVQAARKVFALGTLGYDFGVEARRDTFKQLMPPVEVDGTSVPPNPYDPRQMVAYLRANPSEARPLIWTLNLDLTPVYAIEPVGGYAPGVYERLTELLDRQLAGQDDADYVDRVSVPGVLSGRTVRLFSGQHVPVVEVELTRGLYGWSVAGLAHAVTHECDVPGHNRSSGDGPDRLTAAVGDFLTRLYYDLRNFGATSRDRALNFAATNAVQARQTLAEALGRGMVLQDIDVEKSPYARPDSDTWDVKLRFFDPDNSRRAKRVYRFTIDVKDVMPVTVGEVRSWPEA